MQDLLEEDRIRTCDENSSTDLQSAAFNQTQPPLLAYATQFSVLFERRFSESILIKPLTNCKTLKGLKNVTKTFREKNSERDRQN